MQQKKPDDFVIATGKAYSVKKFIELSARELGMIVSWKGKGIKEKGYDQNGNCIIECREKYFRPSEVDLLIGNAAKARRILKWRPKFNFKDLVKEMIKSDLKLLKNKNIKPI